MNDKNIILMKEIKTSFIDECVKIHIMAFPTFFLSFLGGKFLTVLYQLIVDDPSGMGSVLQTNGHIVGFVIGSSQPSGLYARLIIKSWWRFGWSAFPAFVKKPSILPRLLRAFSKLGQKQPVENYCELMSIAVLPEFQGQGIGKELVQAFLVEARNRGRGFVTLTTDAENNDAVNIFYKNMGFIKVTTLISPEKRVLNLYSIRL